MSNINIELDDAIKFSKKFIELGTSVQEQLFDLVDGDISDINPNAVKLIKEKLGGKFDELDSIIDDYISSN